MKFEQFEDLNKSSDEIFMNLIEKALAGEHSPFEFIRSYDMLKVARLYRAGVKKVAKMFKSLEKELLQAYQYSIESDNQSLEIVMSIKQFGKCAQYYKEECAIVKDMIKEFKTYVMSGHILQTMLGGVRPENECVDYRKLPIKFF